LCTPSHSLPVIAREARHAPCLAAPQAPLLPIARDCRVVALLAMTPSPLSLRAQRSNLKGGEQPKACMYLWPGIAASQTAALCSQLKAPRNDTLPPSLRTHSALRGLLPFFKGCL